MNLRRLLLVLFAATVSLAISAQVRVTGTVVDENNDPVIGASVTQKGNAKNGVATDIDGKFTLMLPSGAHVKVTYVG